MGKKKPTTKLERAKMISGMNTKKVAVDKTFGMKNKKVRRRRHPGLATCLCVYVCVSVSVRVLRFKCNRCSFRMPSPVTRITQSHCATLPSPMCFHFYLSNITMKTTYVQSAAFRGITMLAHMSLTP